MDHPNTCARGCCWTPTSVCAQRRNCACHTSLTARAQEAAQDERDHAIARGDRYRITSKTRSA